MHMLLRNRPFDAQRNVKNDIISLSWLEYMVYFNGFISKVVNVLQTFKLLLHGSDLWGKCELLIN